MRVAKGVGAVFVHEIGRVTVVNARPSKVRKNPYRVQCLRSSLLMMGVISQALGPRMMHPMRLRLDPHARLVEVDHARFFSDGLLYRCLDGLKPSMELCSRVSQSPLRRRASKQVEKHLMGTPGRKKLVLPQVDTHGFEAFSILHRGRYAFGEAAPRRALTSRTNLAKGAMLGDYKLEGWHVVNLPALEIEWLLLGRRLIRKGGTTPRAFGRFMVDYAVGVIHEIKRRARMARLPARLVVGLRTQALLLLGQSVARGRLMAV